MKVIITQQYLVLPVSYHAQNKRISFFENGTLVYDVVARLDACEPDTYQYLDMRFWQKKELGVMISPDMELILTTTDTPPKDKLYREKYRPQCHFTSARGWNNDPNGLIWYRGAYHMFYQHNPVGSDWGNMHWGHAVSTDLLHWEQREEALFPDEYGTMYSGCGIVDVRNVSGFKQGEDDPILLFYTAAGGTSHLSAEKHFTQCIAYSIDGGNTFQKYAGNPVIPNIVGENRDPKVIYYPENDTYYMALYMENDAYTIFYSRNLLNWESSQDINLPEDSECPDFYPLALDGGENIYWILSGASDRYLVGNMENGRFVAYQNVRRLHYGNCSYAAQSFSDIPTKDGRRLRISWNQASVPNQNFNSSFSTPTEMSLCSVNDEILLCINPIREFKNLYTEIYSIKNKILDSEQCFTVPLKGKGQDIRICLSTENGAPFHINLLGLELKIFPEKNRVECKECSMPLYMRDNILTLRFITDTNGIELYVGQGEAFMVISHLSDYNLNRLIITAENAQVTILELDCAALTSIWQ